LNPVVAGTSAAGILIVLVAMVWAAVHFSKSRLGDSRLLGTWQSDADATIAEMRKTRPVTDKQEQAMRKVFGKMKITYTKTTITTDFDGVVESQPYHLVSKAGDSIVIKSWSNLSNQEEEFRIRFVGADTYWVDVQQVNVSEFFKRSP
jgi:hypothetical protein